MKNKTHLLVFAGIVLIVGGLIVFGGERESVSQKNIQASTYEGLQDTMDTMNNKQEYTIVTFTTTLGSFDVELWNEKAPKTVENFLNLSESQFYDGVRFHRVIEGFMIQSGDPLSKDVNQTNRWGTGGPGYVFEDEIHTDNHNVSGTIAMANAGPGTNGSQFFINVHDNSYLDERHTVFGRVVSGYDIVEKISLVDTVPGVDRPIDDVIIESISISGSE